MVCHTAFGLQAGGLFPLLESEGYLAPKAAAK